jgi:tetratricopeptide (TPR) repeat protein
MRLAQAAQNDSLICRGYNLLGNAFLNASDFAPGLDYYFKALALADKSDFIRVGILAGNISFTYTQVGNNQSAVKYGKQAIEVLLANPPDPATAVSSSESYYGALTNAYDNTGIAYIGLNQPDSALYYLQLGYAAVLKSKDKNDIYYKSAIISDLARTYELLNEKRMAEEYYRQAIELDDSLQLQGLSYSTKYYGSYLLRNKRFGEVIHFSRMGISSAIGSMDKISVIDLASLLQQAYEATGRNDSAFYFSKMVNNYRDTVFNNQKMLALQKTALQHQIDEMDEQVRQDKLATERKNNLQYAGIALVIVSLLIFFILISHSAAANQRLIKFLGILALLIVFEFMNLLLHPYIGDLTHHSPVLMLGIMVCLAALLIPLHHKLEYWIIHKLVNRNNKIRLATAKRTIAQFEKEESEVSPEVKD